MSDDPYLYPGTDILRNKLGIREAHELDRVERLLVAQRIREGAPRGNFDLAHLKSIHHHLFQDIYDWAGEIRTVEISKQGQQFQFRRYIEAGMADVHGRLKKTHFLRGMTAEVFAREAGQIIGDVNYVHPFREGNGRAQLLYLEQLAAKASHPLDLAKLEPPLWIEASRQSHAGSYTRMEMAITLALKR